MASPVDPNQVLMTGENSFIRLSLDGGATVSDRLSHWRVLWCPAGTGHVLFAKGELTNGQVWVFGDNVAVARWLQDTIEVLLTPDFGDTSLPVESARFSRSGDPRSSTVELVEAESHSVRMVWYDCIEPFVLDLPPGTNDRPLGVFSTFFPARSAQVSMDGRFARGVPWPEQRGDRQSSSCALAWSETWVAPPD